MGRDDPRPEKFQGRTKAFRVFRQTADLEKLNTWVLRLSLVHCEATSDSIQNSETVMNIIGRFDIGEKKPLIVKEL